MRVERVALRDFRSYDAVAIAIGPGLTVVHGPNGSGKTNLLEALYFGCTGRSFRTADERQLVRFGAGALRVVIAGAGDDRRRHELAVGFAPGEPKRMTSDGAPVARLTDVPHRPLVSVFSPDRLELVKGGPALRRAHLDQFVAALWPARTVTRRAYREALAQRNALIARIRGGRAGADALAPWNATLAATGIALAADRGAAVDLIADRGAAHAASLGIAGEVLFSYRRRTTAATVEELAAELAGALDADLARGYTTRGPHRDDLAIVRDGRSLRRYGSQGEQRVALLALLLAERDALAAELDRPPLLLLDDVMSELDAGRRSQLAVELRRGGGQVVLTATEREHVPGWSDAAVAVVAVP